MTTDRKALAEWLRAHIAAKVMDAERMTNQVIAKYEFREIEKLRAAADIVDPPQEGLVGLDSYVQRVPDHCDRITWRNRYLHLPKFEVVDPPQDKGPWVASADGRSIQSDDFEHDVLLRVSGDFADNAQRIAYTKEIERRLNYADRPRASNAELLAALKEAVGREYNQFEPENQSAQYYKWKALVAKAEGA